MSIANFVQILIEALEKKERLLEEIITLCGDQEECIKNNIPDIKKYTQCSEKKADISKQVEKIDEGFLAVYERVRDELESNPSIYAEEIRKMKALVTSISDKTASIGVKEQRLNKEFRQKVSNSGSARTGNAYGEASGDGMVKSAYSSSAAQKYAQTMRRQISGSSDATFINKKQ